MTGIASKRRGLSSAEVIALIFGATTPSASANTGATGSSDEAARIDHQHPHTPKSVYSTGGNQALVPGDIGAALAPGNTFQLATTPPAFAAAQTAGGTYGRLVFGTVDLVNTAGNAAGVDVEIEDGVGVGTYSAAARNRLQASTTLRQEEHPYCVFVPTGRRYRFTQLGLAGTTEAISHYSYYNL